MNGRRRPWSDGVTNEDDALTPVRLGPADDEPPRKLCRLCGMVHVVGEACP